MTARVGSMAVLAAAAAFATGCSHDKTVAPSQMSNPHVVSLVSEEEVAAMPAGSPERTVLRWWRLTQYKEVTDGITLFTPAARRTLVDAGYTGLVIRYLGPWMDSGKPQVQHVENKDPNHAIVYMQTIFNAPVGVDLVRHDASALALPLVRGPDGWKISDPSWPIQQATVLREQAEAAAPPPAAQK